MSASLSYVLRRLRRAATPAPGRDLTDGELLERFRSSGEEAAFTLLVQRHGPMVFGVCRRAMGGAAADAEDAFQATFLVLARKAAAVRHHDSVAGWLYGVARRVAAKARAGAARRLAREAPAMTDPPAPAPPDETALGELRAALDEEVTRLPDRYRAPVVLCFVEGKTHEEAARELAWPKSTVTARLGRARELLRERLTRRGLAPSAGLVAVALTEEASAAVPARLALAAVRLAAESATGKAAATPAAALADGFGGEAAARKLLLAAGVVLGAGLVAAGALGRRAEPPPAAAPAEKGEAPPAAAAPARADSYGDPLPPGAVARMGTVRLRLGDNVLAAVFGPGDKTLITAGHDSTVRVWDAATGKELRRLDPGPTFVAALALSPDGKTVVARGHDALLVWDLDRGGKPRRLPAHANSTINTSPLALSPDGKRAATTGEDGTVRQWDLASGKELQKFEGHAGYVPALAYSPDGRTLASGGFDGTVRLWSVAEGTEVKQLKGHAGQLWSLAFARDGRTLSCGARGGTSLWDVAAGRKVRDLAAVGVGTQFFTRDGKLMAGGTLWDPATGKEVRGFGDHFLYCSPSADGKKLVSWNNTGAVRLWDFSTGKELRTSVGHRDEPKTLAFVPDGRRLVSGSWRDPAVFVWDAATGELLHQWVGATIPAPLGGLMGGGSDHPSQNGATALAFTDDGKRLAAGTGLVKATLHVWDFATGKELAGFSTGQPSIHGLAFSPDGKTLVAGSYDKQVRLWDPVKGKELRRLDGPVGQHKAVAFSPDGKTLTVAGGGYQDREYAIQAWDAATGAEGRRVGREDGPVATLAFSPDGRLLAVGGFNQRVLRILDVASGNEAGVVPHETWCEAVAFAPDGRSFALAADGKIRLIEAATGKERARFAGHQGMINALAFAPDGNRLASASRDMTLLVWDLTGRAGPAPAAPAPDDPWADLAADDAARAYRAMQTLLAAPGPAAALVRDRLRPAPAPAPAEQERVDRLLGRLDGEKFEDRDRAARELAPLGPAAEVGMRRALDARPSAETRRQLWRLLGRLEMTATPEGRRALRALEVLERAGGADARRALVGLAGGAPQASLTREARASLDRLTRREAAK